MPARGQGRSDAAEMIEHIIDIASDPEAHKTRLAEFEQRRDEADKAEVAARARIEEADRRTAELDKRETEIEARQADVDAAMAFKAHCQELARKMETDRMGLAT